jgi:hypothetical protein
MAADHYDPSSGGGMQLDTYTIYDHPSDYPDGFVVRRFRVMPGGPVATNDVWGAPTLEVARSAVPPGLYCMERSEGDDPCIVETWL